MYLILYNIKNREWKNLHFNPQALFNRKKWELYIYTLQTKFRTSVLPGVFENLNDNGAAFEHEGLFVSIKNVCLFLFNRGGQLIIIEMSL